MNPNAILLKGRRKEEVGNDVPTDVMAMDAARGRVMASVSSAESADRVRERRVKEFWRAKEASKQRRKQEGGLTRTTRVERSVDDARTWKEKHKAVVVREMEVEKAAKKHEKENAHLQNRMAKLQHRTDALESKLSRQQSRNQGLVVEAREFQAERNRTVKECALRVAEVEEETRKRMEEMEEATRMARVVYFARAASAERRALEAERRTAHAMKDALESRKALQEVQQRCVEAEEELGALQKRTEERMEAARKEGYAQAQCEWQSKWEEEYKTVWAADEKERENIQKDLDAQMVPLERALKASERAANAWKARAQAAEQLLMEGKATNHDGLVETRRDHAKERLQRLLSKQQKERSQDQPQGTVQVEERDV